MTQEIVLQGQAYIDPIWADMPIKLIVKNGIVIERYFQTLLSNGELDWWRVWDANKIRFDKKDAIDAIAKAEGKL